MLADEAVLDKLDDRGVIHRDVRDIVLARERRDHDVRHAEAKLRGEAVARRGIVAACAPGSLVRPGRSAVSAVPPAGTQGL